MNIDTGIDRSVFSVGLDTHPSTQTGSIFNLCSGLLLLGLNTLLEEAAVLNQTFVLGLETGQMSSYLPAPPCCRQLGWNSHMIHSLPAKCQHEVWRCDVSCLPPRTKWRIYIYITPAMWQCTPTFPISYTTRTNANHSMKDTLTVRAHRSYAAERKSLQGFRGWSCLWIQTQKWLPTIFVKFLSIGKLSFY